MAPITRLAAVLSLCAVVAGCGYNQVFSSWFDHSAGPGAVTGPKLDGHVYLLRGLAGDIYSLGMDQLADQVTRRGVTATVHGMTEYSFLADEIIRKYRAGEERGPIMLIGHSTGGDLIIAMAQKLKAADIPVALAFGFDPTRIAPNVPSNVELFINLYQTYNPIGGGEEAPGSGFQGRLNQRRSARAHRDRPHHARQVAGAARSRRQENSGGGGIRGATGGGAGARSCRRRSRTRYGRWL